MINIKKEIKLIAVSAIFSAFIVAMLILGTFIELFDITVAAICTFAVCIILMEAKKKYAFLVYFTSSILGIIFVPLSTATLYFIGFFGYYPIIKQLLIKFPKLIQRIIGLIIFNVTMTALMLLFKTIFALTGEPAYMYILLFVTLNVIFICIDYLLDIFPFIYVKKIRNKIKFIF